MNRRALFIALIVAALGVVLLFAYQKRYEEEVAGGERISVLVSTKDIKPGDKLGDDNVGTTTIPRAYVQKRAIRAAEKAKVLGLKIGHPVTSGESLEWNDFTTTTEERRTLAMRVQPGSRAVTIHPARDSSNVALIRPGDYVDVISVMNPPAPPDRTDAKGRSLGSSSSNDDQREAAVILQKVLVLATGTSTSPEEVDAKDTHSSGGGDTALTLSLSPQEAQLVSLASDRGRLAVALRSPDDLKTPDLPDLRSNSLIDSQKRASTTKRPGAANPGGPTLVGGAQ